MLTYRDIASIVSDRNKAKLAELQNAHPQPEAEFLNQLDATNHNDAEYTHLGDLVATIKLPKNSLLNYPEVTPYHAHVINAIISIDKKNPNSKYSTEPALIELERKVLDIVNQFPELDEELQDDDILPELILIFSERDMLDRAMLTRLMQIKRDENFLIILETLDKAGLLNKKMLSFVLFHPQIDVLFSYVLGIDSRKYQGGNLDEAVDALIDLLGKNISCADYDIMNLLELPHPMELVLPVEVCSREDVLTAELFNDLIENAHVFDVEQVPQWLHVTPNVCTVDGILEILEIARAGGDDRALVRELIQREVQDWLEPEQEEIQIPDEQNTHTASIHKSVSTSAEKLWLLYGELINQPYKLKAYLDRVAAWLKRLPDSAEPTNKPRAAKLAFASMRKSEFFDPESKVNLPQMIALAWIVMRRKHYQSKVYLATGKVADKFFEQVFMPLLDALYECQRGYNLDKDGIDNGDASDRVICLPGKFNKMIEKLVGVHEAVELYFLKHEHVMERLAEVVTEVIAAYLKNMSHKDMQELIAFYDKTVPINDFGDPTECDKKIWEAVKEDVIRIMRKENYPAAYGSDDNKFMQVMEESIYGISSEELLNPYRMQTPTSPLRATSLFSPRKAARASRDNVPDVKPCGRPSL